MHNVQQDGFSRRTFIASSVALGGAAALAGAAVPAMAEEAQPTQAYSFETAPDPIPEDQITETYEADVVVAGAGLAGSFAALAAAEEGNSVVVLQKSPAPMTHGIGFACFGAQAQKDKGMEFDLKGWAQYFMKTACGYSPYDFCESYVFNSGPALDMFMNHVTEGGYEGSLLISDGSSYVKWDDSGVTSPYSRCPRMLTVLTDINEKLGVVYLNETPAEQLEVEDGRVAAVIAQGPNGYVRAKANKGVIIATGDIGHDKEMVAKYAPFLKDAHNTYMPADNTGDGHKMMLWAGAKMFQGPFVQVVHFDPIAIDGMPDAPFSGNPYLAVNARGLRYQDENAPYQHIANQCLQQPGQVRWQIVDNTFQENWDKFSPGMCRHKGFMWNTPEEGFEVCLEAGAIMKADTLEELADNIGLEGTDRDNLFATIERYNELVDLGVDEDFGKDPEYLALTPVKNPPFYSIIRAAGPLALVDGVYVAEDMQVLDTEDQPIAGLYAAGNTVHGLYNVDYGINPGGTTTSRAIATGYVAGKAAVGALPDFHAYPAEFSGEGTWVTPNENTIGTGADAGKTRK